MTENAVKVFISYSHKDEDLRDRLDTHLSNLRWDGVISSWYDRQLTAGTEWDEKIKAELEAADIILLLISPDFIASKYCRDVEIPLSLQRHEAKQAFVVPIILRPFDWFTAPFAKLQAFPKDAKPVTTWPNQDEAFLSIAQGIRTAVQLLRAERQQLAEQQQAAEQRYRQQVVEALADGVISLVERDTLDELRDELGLPVEVAAAIEAEAFEPVRRYGENLEKYQQTLNRLIAGGHYPFSAQIKQDLAKRQRDLGLKPEDVDRVAQPILDQVELAEQAKKKQIAEAERSPVTPVSLPLPEIDTVSLVSEKGVDYTKLRDLLKAEKWWEADLETWSVMLQATNCVSDGWLAAIHIHQFPCKDFQTIDRLWMTASKGHFGFSVQKEIYVRCGGKLNGKRPGDQVWEKFGDTVGWRIDQKWQDSAKLAERASLSTPRGIFPMTGKGFGFGLWVFYGLDWWLFFSRIQACEA